MKTTLKVVEDECYSCNKTIKLAFVERVFDEEKNGVIVGAEDFSEDLMVIARKFGVKIENEYSHTMQEKYNANICPYCNIMFGQMFTYKYVYSPLLYSLEIDNSLIKDNEEILDLS